MTKLLVKLFVKNADDVDDPAVRACYGRMAGVVGIVCNLLLALGKLLAGLFSGSIAIVGDAVNNLSDAASSVITLVGFNLAAKPADEEHPFGHARFEYIAGLVVAVLVMVIGLELGKSSVEKIMNPQPVVYGALSFGVLGASIAVKLWMAVFNRGVGRRIGSTALQATFVDSRNDAIATAAVLAAAGVAHFTGLNLDGWMGAAVALFILVSGAGLVKDTLDPLLGQAPDAELVRHVAQKIKSYPGVLGTHDLIVHDYGPGRRFASAHVEMDSADDVLKSHDIIDSIERYFLKEEGIHLIIHYDPVQTGSEATDTARGRVADRVAAIDGRLTIHDFRVVESHNYTTYIFDVLAPPECTLPADELKAQIEKAVQWGKKPIRTKITVDSSYASIPQ